MDNKNMLPKFIQVYLWPSNLQQLDLQLHKHRIILNVLNFGTKQATDWLFNFYSQSEIKETIINQGAKGELNNKSLRYWSLILDLKPQLLISSRF